MKQSRIALAILASIVAMTSCKAGQTFRPPFLNEIWDDYANTDLQVYGAGAETAGQRVYRAIKSQPELTTVLEKYPEPDTLKIIGASWVRKNFELVFTRPELVRQKPYKVAIDRTKEGFIPRAPEPFLTGAQTPQPEVTPAPVATRRSTTRRPPPPPSREQPTAEQKIECPIAAGRSDCKSFCPGPWSWCK